MRSFNTVSAVTGEGSFTLLTRCKFREVGRVTFVPILVLGETITNSGKLALHRVAYIYEWSEWSRLKGIWIDRGCVN